MEFKNGSKIELIKCKNSIRGKTIYDYVIGMDIAKPPCKDFSALSMMCCNCKTIIHTEVFKGEEPIMDRPQVCPNCGTEFRNGLIME